MGLELDNCGRTTKNALCRIYSLWHTHLGINAIDYRWAREKILVEL
jgi:hypothetical protein